VQDGMMPRSYERERGELSGVQVSHQKGVVRG